MASVDKYRRMKGEADFSTHKKGQKSTQNMTGTSAVKWPCGRHGRTREINVELTLHVNGVSVSLGIFWSRTETSGRLLRQRSIIAGTGIVMHLLTNKRVLFFKKVVVSCSCILRNISPSKTDRIVDREFEILHKLLHKSPFLKLFITFQSRLFTSLCLNETDCNSLCLT